MRVLESHGRSSEEREERVEVIVSVKASDYNYKRQLWALKVYTNESSITILPSTCDDRGTFSIGDKKVWSC
jgi:hypothetical protein